MKTYSSLAEHIYVKSNEVKLPKKPGLDPHSSKDSQFQTCNSIKDSMCCNSVRNPLAQISAAKLTKNRIVFFMVFSSQWRIYMSNWFHCIVITSPYTLKYCKPCMNLVSLYQRLIWHKWRLFVCCWLNNLNLFTRNEYFFYGRVFLHSFSTFNFK